MFTLTELSATKIVTWNCHVDDSAKGRYDTILVRYLLTDLGFNKNYLQTSLEHMVKL